MPGNRQSGELDKRTQRSPNDRETMRKLAPRWTERTGVGLRYDAFGLTAAYTRAGEVIGVGSDGLFNAAHRTSDVYEVLDDQRSYLGECLLWGPWSDGRPNEAKMLQPAVETFLRVMYNKLREWLDRPPRACTICVSDAPVSGDVLEEAAKNAGFSRVWIEWPGHGAVEWWDTDAVSYLADLGAGGVLYRVPSAGESWMTASESLLEAPLDPKVLLKETLAYLIECLPESVRRPSEPDAVATLYRWLPVIRGIWRVIEHRNRLEISIEYNSSADLVCVADDGDISFEVARGELRRRLDPHISVMIDEWEARLTENQQMGSRGHSRETPTPAIGLFGEPVPFISNRNYDKLSARIREVARPSQVSAKGAAALCRRRFKNCTLPELCRLPFDVLARFGREEVTILSANEPLPACGYAERTRDVDILPSSRLELSLLLRSRVEDIADITRTVPLPRVDNMSAEDVTIGLTVEIMRDGTLAAQTRVTDCGAGETRTFVHLLQPGCEQ